MRTRHGELGRRLGYRADRVVLVTPENFLLFSPLLAEAASGTIEPRHAVVPLRPMLRRVHVITGAVSELDVKARTATAVDHAGVRHELRFQALVLAPGSVPATLPIPGLAEEAVGFKTLPDAIWLRNRVLAQLEAAHDLPEGDLRRELLTFTFVGGGYAGVEALAELESLTRDALHLYPRLRPVDLRWVLIEAQGTLLPSLSPKLAQYALRHLRSRGVQVLLDTRLRSCVDKVVEIDSPTAIESYRTGTLVWTTGQRPSSFVMSLGLATDGHGRVIIDEFLAVPGHAGVFAIGDAAAVPDPDGGCLTADRAARVPPGDPRRAERCRRARPWREGVVPVPRPRSRRDARQVAGRGPGEGLTFSGFIAWWMGRSYHLLMIPGLARKARVVTDWTIGLLFPRDIAQLGTLGAATALGLGRFSWRGGVSGTLAPRKSAGEGRGEILRGPKAQCGLDVVPAGGVGGEAGASRRRTAGRSRRRTPRPGGTQREVAFDPLRGSCGDSTKSGPGR